MITVLSSPKPGSGTSTTAALLAIAASNDANTTLIDLCGDQPALFNCPTIDGNVYLNDRDVRYRDGLETSVAPDDTLILLPAMAGGTR